MSEEVDVTRKAEYLFAGIFDAWRAVEGKGVDVDIEDIRILGEKIREINAIISVNVEDKHVWDEKVNIFQNTLRSYEKELHKFGGRVEITIEDKTGVVKQRILKNNSLTRAYKLVCLHTCLDLLNTTKRVKIRDGYNFIYKKSIDLDKLSFYCVKEDVKDSPLPVFAKDNAVAFSNANNVLVETPYTIIVNEGNCGFSTKDGKSESVVEYVKTSGSGTFKSIVFGRSNASDSQKYIAHVADIRMPMAMWVAPITHPGFLIEYRNGETILWRSSSSDPYPQVGFNFTTGETYSQQSYSFYYLLGSHSNLASVDISLSLPIRIRDTVFRLGQLLTSNPLSVNLYITENCLTSSTEVTKTITFGTKAGFGEYGDSSTTQTPVLTYKDDNTIEIFQTIGRGVDGEGKLKYYLQKAVYTISTKSYVIVDLGMFDFEVSGMFGNTASRSRTKLGVWDHNTNQYHLPIRQMVIDNQYKQVGSVVLSGPGVQAGHMIGVILDENMGFIDYTTVSDIGNDADAADNGFNQFRGVQMILTNDGVKQVRLMDKFAPFVYSSPMSSYLNLENPITKDEDDMLRIRYIDSYE